MVHFQWHTRSDAGQTVMIHDTIIMQGEARFTKLVCCGYVHVECSVINHNIVSPPRLTQERPGSRIFHLKFADDSSRDMFFWYIVVVCGSIHAAKHPPVVDIHEVFCPGTPPTTQQQHQVPRTQ